MTDKLTINHLAEMLAKECELSVDDARTFITAIFVEISTILESSDDSGDTLRSAKVKGLGEFFSNGTFVPDPSLAEAVNAPFSFFEAVELNDGVTEEMLNSVADESEQSEEPTTQEEQSEPTPEPIPEPEPATVVIPEPEPVIEPELEPVIEQAEEIVQEPVEEPKKPIIETIKTIPPKSELIAESAREEIEEEEERAELSDNKGGGSFSALYAILFTFIGFVMGLGVMYLLIPYVTVSTPAPLSLIEEQTITATDADDADTQTVATKPAIITDTVSSSNFFTTMARRHYGERAFWVYIYEKNAAALDSCHPEKVQPGTVVVIPDAAEYGIDRNNPESLERARSKAVEIYSRF